MPCTEGLIFLSLRWMHPSQQHGRRMPSFSSETTRFTCSRRTSGDFTKVTPFSKPKTSLTGSFETCGLVGERPDAVILGFAGTDPGVWQNLATDFSPLPRRGLDMHGGFVQAAAAAENEIKKAVDLCVTSGRPLFITGHSLGAALAALAAQKASGPAIRPRAIYGFGMNLQNCRNAAFVGLSDSWESVYQATRRVWRFGQQRPVNIHFITGELEGAVVRNIQRKEQQAAEMAAQMLSHMREINTAEIHGTVRQTDSYAPKKMLEVPAWL